MSKENIDVRYVAGLARLDLSDDECETFQGQLEAILGYIEKLQDCLLYTSPSPRDKRQSRMPSSA